MARWKKQHCKLHSRGVGKSAQRKEKTSKTAMMTGNKKKSTAGIPGTIRHGTR
jgi:hypothetical protein